MESHIMIIIVNQYKTKVTSFESYWEVFQHIEQLEKPKQAQRPQNLLPPWSFVIPPYQRALHFHRYMEETLKIPLGARGDRQGLNVLEVCQGNVGRVSLQPILPDLKLEDLKLAWCQAYLKAHGYFSLEAHEMLPFMKPW
jgi:hypothetical protein